MYKKNGPAGIQVHLNVYDLNPSSNASLYNCGLGFYHTGIQLELKQFTFGYQPTDMTGVMEVPPKVNHPNFRETILLGVTTYTYRQIYEILDNIKDKFSGNSYHVIRKNCNTFTNCFADALLHQPIPGWINRMANIGKAMVEINDFFAMRPYDQKYQTSAHQLGVKLAEKKDVFKSDGGGTKIG